MDLNQPALGTSRPGSGSGQRQCAPECAGRCGDCQRSFRAEPGSVTGTDNTTTVTGVDGVVVTWSNFHSGRPRWQGVNQLDPGPADDVIVNGTLGFRATIANMILVTLKDSKGNTDPTDDVSYLGLDLSGLTAKLVGIDDLTFGAWNAGIKLNKVKAGTAVSTPPTKINWKTFTPDPNGLSVPTLAVTSGMDDRARQRRGGYVRCARGQGQVPPRPRHGHEQRRQHQSCTRAWSLTLGTTAFEGAQAVEVFVGQGVFWWTATATTMARLA